MDNKQSLWSLLNKQAFFPPAILLILAVFLGAAFPNQFSAVGNSILGWVTENLGGSLPAVLLFCLFSVFGPAFPNMEKLNLEALKQNRP